MTMYTELNHTARFLDPVLADSLKSRTEPGVIREDRSVELDDFGDTPLAVPEDADLDPGTEVFVSIRDGAFVAVIQEEQKRVEREVKERAERERRERERRMDQAREDAEQFWSEFTIPFEYDVAIKGRRSGLGRGSWGDGRDSRTVEHLYVLEAFEDGRLERDADQYLCGGGAEYRFERERHQDGDGEPYVPAVTCSRCLDLMERWRDENATDGA